MDQSPFHQAERDLQSRYGMREAIEAQGRKMVRDHMPDQHRTFYESLPMILIGSVDGAGRPWASVIAGAEGFISSPDPKTLTVDLAPFLGDPLAESLTAGTPVGLLGIDPETRRRNRMNGRIATLLSGGGFQVAVDQSFGNCPQYIQTRTFESMAPVAYAGPEEFDGLSSEAREIIGRADTLFIASSAADPVDPVRGGADVSHRGGRPGFVDIAADGTLTLPDFAGNFHFNTLGNLAVNPRAGLLFIDFDSGDLLQLTGRAEIILDGSEIGHFQGAERLIRIHPERGVRLAGRFPLKTVFGDYSPNVLMTGNWPEARATAEAEARAQTYRPFRIARIETESAEVKSFYLDPADGHGRAPQLAGQHLPVRLIGADGRTVERTYTLSNAPGDARFRLSVKREPDGVASRILHDELAVGSVIEARAPAGAFHIDASQRRPAVLLAAGIGVTPLLAMFRHLIQERVRTRHMRPTYLLYAARDEKVRAFTDEIVDLARGAEGAVGLHFALSAPGAAAALGRDYQSKGRITLDLLKAVLPFDDHEFFICGPSAFTKDLYDGLRDMGVRDDRIFFENFGPSSVRRRSDGKVCGSVAGTKSEAAKEAVVTLSKSGKRFTWHEGDGTLLEAIEAQGVRPAFGCRAGVCGTCKVPVEGDIYYGVAENTLITGNEALLCCAVPAATDGPAAVTIDL